MGPKAANYSDYQARATAFKLGDCVYPLLGGSPTNGGTVIAVWPAIGMVDVQFPHGATRYPVEELEISPTPNPEAATDLEFDSVPGGAGTVPVSGGPVRGVAGGGKPLTVSPRNIAAAYVKQAVYWASVNRKYRPTKQELETGELCCPRCEDAILRKVVYKKEGGKRVRLFCCPKCLFLLRRDDVLGME